MLLNYLNRFVPHLSQLATTGLRSRKTQHRWIWFIFSAFVTLVIMLPQVSPAQAEGSGDLYPPPGTGNRANFEWRTNDYGGLIKRRTLLHVYAKAGEVILMGSSAVGVPNPNILLPPPNNVVSDIVVFRPGEVTGMLGNETIPAFSAATDFSCEAQRNAVGNLGPTQGQILSRTEELAGPDTVPLGGNPTGYVPCFYTAPVTGIYSVAMYGPDGPASAADGHPTGDIDIGNSVSKPENFDYADQLTSIAAWDVTVRPTLISNAAANINGRLFSNSLALFTHSNGDPLFSTFYSVTNDGYAHQIDLRGLDPLGFVVYANQAGYFDTDGATPLYHDVLGSNNQLGGIAGGVSLAPPEYPLFFNKPSFVPGEVIDALGIPTRPVIPKLVSLAFTGSLGGNKTAFNTGGDFDWTTNGGTLTRIVISSDAISATPNFDPTLPTNRVINIPTTTGPHTIHWDGLDNSGNPFPVSPSLLQPYKVQAIVHAGESHFPMLDAENSALGGPSFTLYNSPGACPAFTGLCSGMFYDDRGYLTLNGNPVPNAAGVNVELCGQLPPSVAFSNQLTGFNSNTTQRAWGFAAGNLGNLGTGCQNVVAPALPGSFGDTKGLDLWTYYPSAPLSTALLIVGPLADMSITKTDNTATYKPGTTTTYTIKVGNKGPVNVTGATVTDTFPANITSASWTCVATGPGSSCTAGPVAGNINDTVNIPADPTENVNFLTYTVVANIAAGTTGNLVNTATVATPPGITDPTPGNNTATDTDTPPGGAVVGGPPPTVGPQALTFTKVADRTLAKPGDPITFTLTAHNGGTTTVTNAVVKDPVPSMFIVKGASSSQGTTSVSGNTVTFKIGTMAAGQTVTMTINTIIDPGLKPPANATNVATLTSDQYPPLQGSVSFDYSTDDPSAGVHITSGVLPRTGEHPDNASGQPWLFVVTFGLAGIAFALGRRKQSI